MNSAQYASRQFIADQTGIVGDTIQAHTTFTQQPAEGNSGPTKRLESV